MKYKQKKEKTTADDYLSRLESVAEYFPTGYNKLPYEEKIKSLEKLNLPKERAAGTYLPTKRKNIEEELSRSAFNVKKIPKRG